MKICIKSATSCLEKVHNIYCRTTYLMERVGMSLILVVMRLYVARDFFNSGLSKITIWCSTLSLFRDEYQVPFIPFELAAYLSTFFELTCSILLVFGFLSRFAALPLLFMTAVIQLTYISSMEHFYWAVFLCAIIFYGPGKISFDYFIHKKFFAKNEQKNMT